MSHLTERISESLVRQHHPERQRGVVLGTHQRAGTHVSKNSFGVKTLVGNWVEEQADTRFHSNRAVIMSDHERSLKSELQATIGKASPAAVRREEPHVFKADQVTLAKVIDKQYRVFPGHQPEVDLNITNQTFDPYETEQQSQYSDPSSKAYVLRRFVGGKKTTTTDLRPPQERVDEYCRTYTFSGVKTQSRFQSESSRAFRPIPKQLIVALPAVGIPLIDQVRQKVWQRGGRNGFRSLVLTLRTMDENGNRTLERDELLYGLQRFGLKLTDQDMDGVMDYFDRDRSGTVSIAEFIRAVRGPMVAARRSLLHQAYACLDVNGDQSVSLLELLQLYDVRNHPDVLSKQRTPEQVMADFAAGWDKNHDATITFAEFCDYYEDISAAIDSDEYFELMIRNAWHLSGGEGAAANTSCRRVVVTHTNGRQTVEEIKNDLRIQPDDVGAMRRNLELQGITDIESISLAF